jgi:hypothetical protein
VALVEMIGKLGRTFGHGVTYDANLHAKLRRRYRCSQIQSNDQEKVYDDPRFDYSRMYEIS